MQVFCSSGRAALAAALASVSMAAISASGGALAQGAQPAARGSLDEVTVTAQRREENQQDVPISITTVPEDRLQQILQGADDIRALATRVPGLYAESSNGRVAPRFYIRGLGNTDFDLAASQPVSVVLDDIVMENVVLKSFPLFDVKQVEVLRGPQGTLFGRNTPAGIVKIDTVRPGDEFGGFISGSIGRFATAKVEAAVGGPLVDDRLSYRASFLYQRRNDWVDNGATGDEDVFGGFSDIAGRLQLRWTPTDSIDALLNFHARNLKGTSELFRANIIGPGNNQLNGNFDRNVVYYDGGAGNNQRYNTYGGSFTGSIDLGGAVITSITGYETADGFSRGDIDGGVITPGLGAPVPAGLTSGVTDTSFPPDGIADATTYPGFIPFGSDTIDGIDDLDQFTEEVRIASDGSGAFNWQAGFYYFDSKLVITTNPFFAPPTTVRHDNTSWAVFGQGSYRFTDRLTFTGGVRYTDDKKDFVGVVTNFPVAPVHTQDGKVSWDASLVYTLTEGVNVYARVARGFRAPSIQGRNVAFFDPVSSAASETVLSYEGGFKSELFNRRVRLNATGFYYDANNLQFSAIGGAGNLNILVNADGRAWGFEADGEFLLADNFLVTAGASYNNTRITEPGLFVVPCGGGCTVHSVAVFEAFEEASVLFRRAARRRRHDFSIIVHK